jgi:archaellum biogenesis ATPase FlaH
MELFVEVAIGSPQSRGLLMTLGEYEKNINEFFAKGQTIPIYRSHYLYDNNAMDFVNSNSSLKDYMGKRYIDSVLIDIDKKDNSDNYTLQQAKEVVRELMELELKEGNYKIYYSGTGYHVIICADCFGFEPHEDLPYMVKQTMTQLIKSVDIDPAVYMRTAIYREEGTKNPKSNLFKTLLPFHKFNSLEFNDVKELAKKPSTINWEDVMWGDGSLDNQIQTAVEPVRAFKAVQEPTKVVPCVQQMWKDGPNEGSRNNIILRIASHFRRNGIPSDATKAALLHWNQDMLSENIILEKVESVYNNGYQYGCKDPEMKSRCQTHCIHYKRKDYTIDVKDFAQLQQRLEERMSTDFSGRTIDLSKIFGLPNLDCTIYPGELVTIFGPTGAGKTTVAQNIILGYNSAQDRIDPDTQLRTLYLSLELSDWYMHKRHIQIVADVDKQQVESNVKQIADDHKELLDHVIIQTIQPTVDDIAQKIKELDPQVVVVDYIDLIDAGPSHRGEYEGIRYISHTLSNMAVNNDIIIIQLSQVSREYSKNDVLDLYAGKGSGAIENASRKVIGINGQSKDPVKYLSLFKNSDGELFEDIPLRWRPSFRLRRDYDR